MFHVIGSNGDILMSGRVWNNPFLIILDDITLMKTITCFLMYLRKSSEDHLTADMIKHMGTFSKNIAIAATDITEWAPMYFDFNPSSVSPIYVTSGLNSFRRVFWVMYRTATSFMTEHMGVYIFDSDRLRVFWSKEAADRNGQRTGSPVASCVVLSIFLPLFRSLKVRDTAWSWKFPEFLNSTL